MSNINYSEIIRYILTVIAAIGIMASSVGLIALNILFKKNRRK